MTSGGVVQSVPSLAATGPSARSLSVVATSERRSAGSLGLDGTPAIDSTVCRWSRDPVSRATNVSMGPNTRDRTSWLIERAIVRSVVIPR